MSLHATEPRLARFWPLPATIALLATGGFVVTIERVPIPWTDEVIYASIARSVQLTGTGFPTVLDGTPAIDHVGFYGPVFFELAARLFDVFGFSAAVFRSIGIAGAVLIAVSGAALVRTLGGSRHRQWWSAAMLLLTPEVGRGATDGRMDLLAVGLALAALAVYASSSLMSDHICWPPRRQPSLLRAEAASARPLPGMSQPGSPFWRRCPPSRATARTALRLVGRAESVAPTGEARTTRSCRGVSTTCPSQAVIPTT